MYIDPNKKHLIYTPQTNLRTKTSERGYNWLKRLNSAKHGLIVRQYPGEFKGDLELDFKLFFFIDSGSAYIVLEKSV